ncbi:hypothetical protein D3C72_2047320 [compost metagenome]
MTSSTSSCASANGLPLLLACKVTRRSRRASTPSAIVRSTFARSLPVLLDQPLNALRAARVARATAAPSPPATSANCCSLLGFITLSGHGPCCQTPSI